MQKANRNDYTLGMQLLPTKIGYAAMDKDNNLLSINHKLAIGTRLFSEGQTAQDRRAHRISVRRTNRKKMRMHYWKNIFRPEIEKETGDTEFFDRLKQSSVSNKDEANKRYYSTIFPDWQEEAKYQREFPTIYHLRQALMTEHTKFDLRLVAIAIKNIIKYPGNFLSNDPVSNFKTSAINSKKVFEEINEIFKDVEGDKAPQFDTSEIDTVDSVMEDWSIKSKDKIKTLVDLLVPAEADTEQIKRLTEAIKGIVGNKAKINVLFNVAKTEIDEPKDWSVGFSDTDIDEKAEFFSEVIGGNYSSIMVKLRSIYNSVMLTRIVPAGMTFSQAKVKAYEKHKKQKKALFEFAESLGAKEEQRVKDLYALYATHRSRFNTTEAKLRVDPTGKTYSLDYDTLIGKGIPNKKDDYEYLYQKAFLKEIIENHPDAPHAQDMLKDIEEGSFLLKQHGKDNAVIPYQLMQTELDAIIENQKEFYPFLAKPNPVEMPDKKKKAEWLAQHPYELDQLVAFRIPYYVGPLITPEEQAKSINKNGTVFAWLVRRKEGKITPWNVEEMVDMPATADAFIRRMTATDTYLLSEPVLPKNSMMYQEFEVLNELNNIKVNGEKLTYTEKKKLIDEAFKVKKTVSVKTLVEVLGNKRVKGAVKSVTGLSDTNPDWLKRKFTFSLSTYIDYKKMFGDLVDDMTVRDDMEKMIEWATVFPDAQTLSRKIEEEIRWITKDGIKSVCSKHYQGWGRLSKKLLTMTNENNQSVLYVMLHHKKNFNQAISNSRIRSKIEKHNMAKAKVQTLTDILNDTYATAPVKKTVRQALKIFEDVVQQNHGKAPKYLALTSSLTKAQEDKQEIDRSNNTRKMYHRLNSDLITDDLIKEADTFRYSFDRIRNAEDRKKVMTDKQYLYFMQVGRDALTGEKIDFKDLASGMYVVANILSKYTVQDQSTNNRILTAKKNVEMIRNSQNSDDESIGALFANDWIKDLQMNVETFWTKLHHLGMMPNVKFDSLSNPEFFHGYDMTGFARRQFQHASHAVKIVAMILKERYPSMVIVPVKREYVDGLRRELNLYGSDLLNDYKPAQDAYLAGLTANYFLAVYPRLRNFFAYGQYMKKNKTEEDQEHEKERKYIEEHIKHFNYLWRLMFSKEDKITSNLGGDVLYSRKDLIEKMNYVMNLKAIRISSEVYSNDGAMFGATIYQSHANQIGGKPKRLIPLKKGKSVEYYGGYTNSTFAFLSLVRVFPTKKEPAVLVVGIPTRLRSELSKLKGDAFTKRIEDYLKTDLLENVGSGKNKKQKPVKFEILVPKLLFGTRIKDNLGDYIVRSSTYRSNAMELVLTQEATKYILDFVEDPLFKYHKNIPNDLKKDDCLVDAFVEIQNAVASRYTLLEIGDARGKISSKQALDKFKKMDYQSKVIFIKRVLTYLHPYIAPQPIPELKVIGSLSKKNTTYSNNAGTIGNHPKVIFTSPSGLKEKVLQF